MTNTSGQPWLETAREYLVQQLGPRAPLALRFEGLFEEKPLEGEGTTALFSFDLPALGSDCGPENARHFVAVGETAPNYFPGYGFSASEAYSFHLGSRYALVVGLERLPDQREPAGARERMREIVRGVAPRAALEAESLAALFACGAQTFAVYRLRLDGDGEDVYFLGADCPAGFYRLTEFPPQVALRLHLGQLIRAERPRRAPEQDW